jgi:hypothetical protein
VQAEALASCIIAYSARSLVSEYAINTSDYPRLMTPSGTPASRMYLLSQEAFTADLSRNLSDMAAVNALLPVG